MLQPLLGRFMFQFVIFHRINKKHGALTNTVVILVLSEGK